MQLIEIYRNYEGGNLFKVGTVKVRMPIIYKDESVHYCEVVMELIDDELNITSIVYDGIEVSVNDMAAYLQSDINYIDGDWVFENVTYSFVSEYLVARSMSQIRDGYFTEQT